MKKLTQIFILFIVIIILSSTTFINIFKESFIAELSDNEKNIINNLSVYNDKINTTKNLLSSVDMNLDNIKNYKTENDDKINKSAKSITKINSTNLTLKNQIDLIQGVLEGGSLIPVQKLGIEQTVVDTPIFSSATLLSINEKINQPIQYPTETPQPTQYPTETPQPIETISQPSEEILQPSEAFNTGSFTSKKSKEVFMNLLNSSINQPRKPVEHFESTDWRKVWKSKLESINQTTLISDNLQEINDEKTKFYIVKNNNLEKNLEDTTADLIKMKIKDASEILRDKWIKNNNINKN